MKKIILMIFISYIYANADYLKLYNLHTKEKIEIEFKKNKIISNKTKINNFFRDHRENKSISFNKKVLINLYKIAKKNNFIDKEISILSGYRTTKTNNKLKDKFKKTIAKKSMHMLGKAIDFRLDTNLKSLFINIKKMKLGGVGLYTNDDFIHIDSGKIRSWGE